MNRRRFFAAVVALAIGGRVVARAPKPRSRMGLKKHFLATYRREYQHRQAVMDAVFKYEIPSNAGTYIPLEDVHRIWTSRSTPRRPKSIRVRYSRSVEVRFPLRRT